MNTDFLIGRNFQRKRAFQQKKGPSPTPMNIPCSATIDMNIILRICLTGMKNQEIHLPTPNPEHPYGGGNGRYRFPDINGMNLLGDNISLPPIVPKSFHIMLTVFHPETLYGMKKWLPFCEDLRKQYKHTPTPVEYSILLVLQPPPIEGDVPAFTQALGDFPDFT